jgi:hypothetical protein
MLCTHSQEVARLAAIHPYVVPPSAARVGGWLGWLIVGAPMIQAGNRARCRQHRNQTAGSDAARGVAGVLINNIILCVGCTA